MLEHRSDGELVGGPSQMELDSFPCNISHVWLPAVSNLPSLHGFGADLALKCALPNDVITPVISCHQTSNWKLMPRYQDDWKHNTRTICTSSIHCLTVKVLTQSQGGSPAATRFRCVWGRSSSFLLVIRDVPTPNCIWIPKWANTEGKLVYRFELALPFKKANITAGNWKSNGDVSFNSIDMGHSAFAKHCENTGMTKWIILCFWASNFEHMAFEEFCKGVQVNDQWKPHSHDAFALSAVADSKRLKSKLCKNTIQWYSTRILFEVYSQQEQLDVTLRHCM